MLSFDKIKKLAGQILKYSDWEFKKKDYSERSLLWFAGAMGITLCIARPDFLSLGHLFLIAVISLFGIISSIILEIKYKKYTKSIGQKFISEYEQFILEIERLPSHFNDFLSNFYKNIDRDKWDNYFKSYIILINIIQLTFEQYSSNGNCFLAKKYCKDLERYKIQLQFLSNMYATQSHKSIEEFVESIPNMPYLENYELSRDNIIRSFPINIQSFINEDTLLILRSFGIKKQDLIDYSIIAKDYCIPENFKNKKSTTTIVEEPLIEKNTINAEVDNSSIAKDIRLLEEKINVVFKTYYTDFSVEEKVDFNYLQDNLFKELKLTYEKTKNYAQKEKFEQLIEKDLITLHTMINNMIEEAEERVFKRASVNSRHLHLKMIK